MRVTFGSIGVSALTALALLTAPAESGAETMAELYEAAKKEGTLTLIGPPSQVMRRHMRESFAKAFPDIKLEYSGMRTYQIHSKVNAERKAGITSIDILINGPTTIPEYRQKIEPLIVTEDAKRQDLWLNGEYEWVNGERTALALVWQTIPAVLINTDVIDPKEISSDKDLLDPKWKGKMTAGVPTIPGAAKLTFRRLYDLHGPDFLRQLSKQDITYTRDYRQGVDWVVKGRYPIGIAPSSTITQIFFRRGVKNIKLLGAGHWQDVLDYSPGFGTLIVPEETPHPAATKLAVNWLLSKDGQLAVSKGMGLPALRRDVDSDHTIPVVRWHKDLKFRRAFTDEYYANPNEKGNIALMKSLGAR